MIWLLLGAAMFAGAGYCLGRAHKPPVVDGGDLTEWMDRTIADNTEYMQRLGGFGPYNRAAQEALERALPTGAVYVNGVALAPGESVVMPAPPPAWASHPPTREALFAEYRRLFGDGGNVLAQAQVMPAAETPEQE